MKSTIIISAVAFTGSALTSAVSPPRPGINALAARLVDPATMDPTRLSVLSVLKTGMPAAPNSPMPTGDYEPEWYQALPGDVKSLLPALYPVAAVAVAEPTTTASEVSVIPTPSVAGTSAAEVKTFTDATMVSSELSASSSPAPTPTSSSTPSSSASASSLEPWTSHLTLTKTLQYASPLSASSATASVLPLSSNLLPNTTTPQATGSGVLPSTSASSTNFLSSAGAKTSIRTETLAVIAWVSVGAGFFFFA
jgi:hypothetical protein